MPTSKSKSVSADTLRSVLDELENIEMTAQGIGQLLSVSLAIETDEGTLFAVFEGEHPEWKIIFK